MALTKKQVKQLRGLATKLNPLIQVGKNDLSEKTPSSRRTKPSKSVSSSSAPCSTDPV